MKFFQAGEEINHLHEPSRFKIIFPAERNSSNLTADGEINSNSSAEIDWDATNLNISDVELINEVQQEQENCSCKEFITITDDQLLDLTELDKIDPFTNLTNRETIYKRHPNLGPQAFGDLPRCDLIPHFTR